MQPRTVISLAVLAAVWACDVPDYTAGDRAPAIEEGLSLALGADIHYTGAFDWQDAEHWDNGYAFTTALGYHFRIEKLYVATYSLQLRPCEQEVASSANWGVALAFADHVVDDDPSIVIADVAEDALAGSVSNLGFGEAASTSYCQAFLLSTPLSTPPNTIADDVIVIAGWYLAPLGSDWVTFDARVPLGEGTLATLTPSPDLTAAGTFSSGEPAEVTVLITRYPIAAFARARPDLVSGAEFAWGVLGDLLHTSTATYQFVGG